jgi:hypothetical protein
MTNFVGKHNQLFGTSNSANAVKAAKMLEDGVDSLDRYHATNCDDGAPVFVGGKNKAGDKVLGLCSHRFDVRN